MDYFSGAGGGDEPQQLGRTRAQTARNQARIDRPQTVNDGVAQLGRTRGQTARNQGGMQHGLLSLMAAREGTRHVLYHQAPPHKNPSLPSRPVIEFLTPSSYSEAFADEYYDLGIQAMEKEYGGLENAGTFGAM